MTRIYNIFSIFILFASIYWVQIEGADENSNKLSVFCKTQIGLNCSQNCSCEDDEFCKNGTCTLKFDDKQDVNTTTSSDKTTISTTLLVTTQKIFTTKAPIDNAQSGNESGGECLIKSNKNYYS